MDDAARALLRKSIERNRAALARLGRESSVKRDIWVDFNDIEDGHTSSPVEFAERSLRSGERVIAGDDEGNHCQATVVTVDLDTVVLRLDLDTFVTE